MWMRCAALRPSSGKPVDQRAQAMSFRSEVSVTRPHKPLRRRSVPAQRLFVPKLLQLHYRAQDPTQKHPRRKAVPYRPFHRHRTMCYRLRRIHLSPLALVARLQPRDPLFHFFHRLRFVEIFHEEILLQTSLTVTVYAFSGTLIAEYIANRSSPDLTRLPDKWISAKKALFW